MAFAVALSRVKRDVVVDIYESKQTYSEIGAGVGMWPRVWETMRALGLEEGLKRELGAFPGGENYVLLIDVASSDYLQRWQVPVQKIRSKGRVHVREQFR